MKIFIKLLFILITLLSISCNKKIESKSSSCFYCEEPKYAELFLFNRPTDLIIYFDYEQGVRCAKAQNKPIFLTFTGHGVIGCPKGNFWYWVTNSNIHNILKDKYVVIALYVDDKTPLEPHETYISETLEKEIKSIGAKNSDFQISRFDKNSQPFSIILDSNGNKLTEPIGYRESFSEILEYLQNGIVVFREKHCQQNNLIIIALIGGLMLCLITILILLHKLKLKIKESQ